MKMEDGETITTEVSMQTEGFPDDFLTTELYATGNRLITSGHIEVEEDEAARISRIVEVTGEDNAEVVYEIVISGFEQGESRQVYRAERMSLYPEEDS